MSKVFAFENICSFISVALVHMKFNIPKGLNLFVAIGILLKNKSCGFVADVCMQRTYLKRIRCICHSAAMEWSDPGAKNKKKKKKKKQKKNENISADVISLHVNVIAPSSIEYEAIFHFFCYYYTNIALPLPLCVCVCACAVGWLFGWLPMSSISCRTYFSIIN